MRLTDILSPERVAFKRANGGPFDKEKAIAFLAALIGERDGVTPREIERALLEREQLQSTGIGEGVAIPHGALPHLTEQVAALLIVPEGVEFQAIDDAHVRILFGIVTPKRATGEHLKTLARVSRLLRNREFRTRLVSAPDEQSAYELIRVEEGASMPSAPASVPPPPPADDLRRPPSGRRDEPRETPPARSEKKGAS